MAGKKFLKKAFNNAKKFLKKLKRSITRKRGGGLGNSYGFGANISPGAPVGNAQEVVPMSSCMATPRFGEISYPTTGLGLPGMSGGSRRRRQRAGGTQDMLYPENLSGTNWTPPNSSSWLPMGHTQSMARPMDSWEMYQKGGSRRQRGGRYSFDLSQPVPGAAAPWAGGIPPVIKIPCESSLTTANPLNQRGGVGGVDSAFYASPTAGYTNVPSSWVGSTGTPSLLQTPYDARTTPPVCMKTGGGKRNRRGTRRNRRKSTRRSRRNA